MLCCLVGLLLLIDRAINLSLLCLRYIKFSANLCRPSTVFPSRFKIKKGIFFSFSSSLRYP